MKRQDWTGPRKPATTKAKFEPMVRLTIPELQTKIDKLDVRCRVGSDRVLFMRMEGNPQFNLANAFLGQLQAEREKLKKELKNALAWKEAGWED